MLLFKNRCVGQGFFCAIFVLIAHNGIGYCHTLTNYITLLRGMPLRVGNARVREKANAPASPRSSQRSMDTRIRDNLRTFGEEQGIAPTTGALPTAQVKANAIKPACLLAGRAGVPSPREPKRLSCERHSP